MIIIGDTHGLRPIFKLIDDNKWENQILIHVGDFGLGFQPIERDIHDLRLLNEALEDTNNTLYIVRGNHDNPIFWDKSKGLYLPDFSSLLLVEDYTVLNIENKTVFIVGGGISIDRQIRKTDTPPTFWEDEKFRLLPAREFERIFNYVKKIDIVVTHSAPLLAYPKDFDSYIVKHYDKIEYQHGNDLIYELREEREDMNILYKEVCKVSKPEYWFYGHFHNSHEEDINGTKFKLLNINEIYEVK